MNNLIKTFGKEKRWVNWKYEEVKGKKTKVPYSPATLGKASSVDESTWSTYEVADKKSENIGIVFTQSQMLLGIDIDHCVNKKGEIEHEQSVAIKSFISQAQTYCEYSPSGSGLHLFLKLASPLVLQAHKKAPFELYTSGRYFTVTENPFKKDIPVRTVSSEEANLLLSVLGYPWAKEEKKDISASSNRVPLSLSDEPLLSKMFSSKNGKEIKSLYEGDISAYGNDNSSADMALCSHLAFWSGKNSDQMERIWLSSPLGGRLKTKERGDYRKRTIEAAIKSCKDVYSVLPEVKVAIDVKDQLLFILGKDKEKVFIQNTENICRILRHHPDFSGMFRYDLFKNTIEIKDKNSNWRVVESNDAVNVQTKISILFLCFGRVGKEMVYDAIIKVAKENEIDSACDFIRSLSWDGTARLDTWLSKTYGVPNDLYHRAVASNWFKGLVKRLIEPGCKFDYVLVLEGPQGTKKSTSLYVLGGSWHVETAMSTDSKDFFMQFAGKAIVEFSEGETLSRTEVKRMKAIITMQSDKYRPPYERVSQDFPRRCVFAMTTNQEEYLKDETGNRRWLPVKVIFPQADIEWLKENREQLFAEAYHRVSNLKETIYEFPVEETLAVQAARRIHDPNQDLISDWYWNELTEDERERGVTVHQAYRFALNGGFSSKPLNRFDEMSIASVYKDFLNLIKRQSICAGDRSWRWFNPAITMKMEIPKKEKTVQTSIDEDIDAKWN